ncbi:MAG: M28 family peptidase [Phycisphaerales bacterium]
MPARQPRPWSLAGAIAAAIAVATPAIAQKQDREGVAAAERIVEGPVNVYGFSPEESFIDVDASRLSFRDALESLGPEAVAWYQHVLTLSNPYFEGRAPGSPGIERAADYLEYWMVRDGLEPAFGEGYRQAFILPSRRPDVLFAAVSADGEALEEGEDFRLLPNAGGGEVEGPLAFVGYGIEDGPDGYDSFAAAGDLDGKVVMVFRYEPIGAEGTSLWSERRFSRHAALADKFAAIAKRGAAAILLVNPPGVRDGAEALELPRRGGLGPQLSIPAFIVSPEMAARLLAGAGAEASVLATWREAADQAKPLPALAGGGASIRVAVEIENGVETSNIAGVLPGAGALADEWVVLGAHYDHIGETAGEDGAIEVNPGADDNASGTSAVLVLAAKMRAMAEAGELPESRRSVLFIAFTAEESGLNGSRHFVQNPTVSADQVAAMVNLDMIGRLRNDEIVVGGVRSGEGLLERIRPHLEASDLLVRADPSGRGPSDHSNFYGASIPVLFFFTGVHESYHQPGDRGHTVNPAGAAKVMALVENILLDLVSGEKVAFASPDAAPAASPDRGYAGVRLGVQPGLSEGEGVKVEAVSEGTSAAEAGILAGDVILSWDGTLLMGAGDMMAKLRSHEPGDVATLIVVRDGKEQEIKVTLKASGGARRGN